MSRTLLIFLHGSGGNGPELRSFLDSVPLKEFGMKTFFNIAAEKSIDYLCPTAIERPYSPAMGEQMNVWFDRSSNFIREGTNDAVEDLEGANTSVNQIIDLVNSVQVSYTDIFLGGFSQGGCLSLHLLREEHSSRLPNQTRGIFSLGSFLINDSIVLAEQRISTSRSQSDLPVLMMHGEDDSMIRLEWGEQTATALLLRDRDVQFKNYPGVDHEIAIEELKDLLYWVDDVIEKNVALVKATDETKAKHSRLGKALLALDISDNVSQKFVEMEIETEYKLVSTAASTENVVNGAHTGDEHHPHVPYTIEPSSKNDATNMVTFNIPSDMLQIATARPILACGGAFDLHVCEQQSCASRTNTISTVAVQTEVVSSDPDRTAQEIGKRLFVRLSGNGASLRACPMS